MSKEIVMSDSPEAAQYRTDLKGWVSRGGFYFGDGPQGERTARYSGCTHVPCSQCGTPTPKGYTMCRDCRDSAYIAKYEAMPRAEWDGKAMVYSEARDRYYNRPDDAADDLEDGETLADMRLVICTPNYARQIEPDFFCDDLPSAVARLEAAGARALSALAARPWGDEAAYFADPCGNVIVVARPLAEAAHASAAGAIVDAAFNDHASIAALRRLNAVVAGLIVRNDGL